MVALQPFRLKQVRVATVCYKTSERLVFCVLNVVTSFTAIRGVQSGNKSGGIIMKIGYLPCTGRITIVNSDSPHPVCVCFYKILYA